MLRLFGQFGRSRDLRTLDQELRTAGVHPALVPEAVKFTILRLLKQSEGATVQACAEAATLLGYGMLGSAGFTEANGPDLTAAVERRVERAIEAGDSLDAQLILLALHADLLVPAVVERYDLRTG